MVAEVSNKKGLKFPFQESYKDQSHRNRNNKFVSITKDDDDISLKDDESDAS